MTRDVAGRGLVATLATEMHNMRMHTKSCIARAFAPFAISENVDFVLNSGV